MNFSAVILAGGKSSRMGSDKAWLNIGGRPLVALAVENMRRLGLEQVFISGRADVDYSALNCPVLQDRQPELGPLGGIESGLAACQSPLLLVLAVDMARMTPDFLRQLMAQCDSLTGAVPELANGSEPLAAVYPQRCLEIAREAILHSRLSARGFAETCRQKQAVRFWPVPPEAAPCLANWNRLEDLPLCE